MSKKIRNERKKLNEKGIVGSIQKRYNSDNVTIDFRFDGNPLGLEKFENFSEKSVLNFVVQSYANSCLTLLKRVEEYENKNTYSAKDNCILRYLPALYCFRHYLELKLKYLYMYYANEAFNSNCHNLSELLQELKEKGFSSDIFKAPIEYIENLENNDSTYKSNDYFFRYLIDKELNCKEHLVIPIFEFKKIKDFILNIEYQSSLLLTNKFLNAL